MPVQRCRFAGFVLLVAVTAACGSTAGGDGGVGEDGLSDGGASESRRSPQGGVTQGIDAQDGSIFSPPSWWGGTVQERGDRVVADAHGTGADEAAAQESARDAAAGMIATMRQSLIESEFMSESRQEIHDGDVYEVAISHGRTLVQAVARIGELAVERSESSPFREVGEDDVQVQVWIRVSAPAQRVFPHRRLLELERLRPQGSADQAWVERLRTLARDYEAEAEPELARLAWSRVVGVGGEPSDYRRLAALQAEAGIGAAARLTLERLLQEHRNTLDQRARQAVQAELQRLALPGWIELTAQLDERIRQGESRRDMALTHRGDTWHRVNEPFSLGIYSAEPSAIALMWRDDDGLYFVPWRDVATVVEGEHNIGNLQGTATGTVHLYAIATPAAAHEFKALLPIKREEVALGNAEAVARFQRLLAAFDVWLTSNDTRASRVTITLR